MKKEGFYIFIVDDEEKIFTVWFVKKDSEINQRIEKKNLEGREIRCFTSVANHEDVYEKIKQYEKQMNYKYTLNAIIF